MAPEPAWDQGPGPTCTSSSLLTLLLASCSPSPPLWVQSASISSMKITEGARMRASSNRHRTMRSLSPLSGEQAAGG
jgi:hypothetical protein